MANYQSMAITGPWPLPGLLDLEITVPYEYNQTQSKEGVSGVNGYWRTTFTIPNCCHHHFPFFFKFSRKHHLLPLLLSISVACFVNSIHCQEYLCFQGTLYYWRQFSLKKILLRIDFCVWVICFGSVISIGIEIGLICGVFALLISLGMLYHLIKPVLFILFYRVLWV